MEKFAVLAPTCSICLNIAGCVMYALAKDYGRAVYWGAAAVLTSTITFWIK